ncbi:putative F-box protein At1g31090 isoform X2 [Arabidopsis lyrata subsp. lyrata]|uniref:putative F-box protein At1g31090 isoform X2 n=1 Tax=Arabidopsis lyrata subsp. lyrata TaxID=81972 RepID=UPI000A29B674|nr:putative F-box protein At1g31090 isoform X2 [Arabidopsis lyrata subsp. lyrata]XP_020869925.1 putative F-box protein At1g31090 isoform X2 [Arabidopsis lyrata subsp. lyrata]|eukprot:XP_020869600.1 putative F-box protein At1g31090 isoform X2 [Arabidopsis lyrata subsp. lyrata]
MNRLANSDSIPTDLIYEILSRLHAKSIARFRCVSKLWKYMLCQPYFTKLFHTNSSSNPRLLIGVVQGGEWSFFSSPQPKNHYENSSCVVAADFHMKFSEDRIQHYCSYASGLIYFANMRISKDDENEVRAICNPSTGQYAILPPDLKSTLRSCNGFLGFDPIGMQFKGKFGVINLEDNYARGFPLKLRIWVLDNVEKQEWTTYAYTLRAENIVKDKSYIYVVGVTASGEIVLAKMNAYKPFYVFYFNPEKNTLQSVEIQGVREEDEWFYDHRVYYFVDHVEDLRFDVMKTTYAATSISPPEHNTSTSSREDHQVRTVAHRHRFESVNKFDALCLLEDD